MAWVDISFPAVDDLADEDLFATLDGNIVALHRPPLLRLSAGTNVIAGTAGVGTLTVDSLNDGPLIVTRNTSFMAMGRGVFSVTAPPEVLRLGFSRFTTGVAGTGTFSEPTAFLPFHNYAAEASRGTGQTLGWLQLFQDVPPGTHMFHCMWVLSGSGSGTLHSTFTPEFKVWEI